MTDSPEHPHPAAPQEWCRLALIVTIGLFAVWGMAQWIYNVIFPHFAQFFELDPSETAWTQSLFNITYCVLAIPAALFHRQFGYKLGMIFALSVFSLGPFLLYPAITRHGYDFFLGSVVMMGAGWAWLETSLNPLAVALGRPETAIRRLNLAQAFYPVGLLAGSYLAQRVLQSNYRLPIGELAQAVARPYVWVGLSVLLLAFLIENLGFPKAALERAGKISNARKEFRTLLAKPAFRLAAAALCCLVLAQTGTWGATFSYVMHEVPNATAPSAGAMIVWSCVIFAIGRFAGTAIMSWLDPNRLLVWCASLSLILVAASAALGGVPGLACLMSSSLFMSIIYPTIFATAIRDLGPLAKVASGLLVTTAGFGAAAGTLLMPLVLEWFNVRAVTALPIPCFVVILAFAATTRRTQDRSSIDAARAALAG